ncbi:MAG: hypothetical protein WBP42_04170 [Candidatus Zixiibacteriota bacterium]
MKHSIVFRFAAGVIMAATIILSLLSCSSDECTLNCNGELRFPLVVGYSWQYEREEHITNFRPENDSITEVPTDTLRLFYITLTDVGTDTLLDGTVVHVIHEVMSDGDSLVSEGYQYFGNGADGLYHYTAATTDAPILLFKPIGTVNSQNPRAELARKSLEYPLQEGLQWEYTNGFDYGPAGAIYKRVIGIGEQNVPAGNFECYAIDWLWENLAGAEMTEYFSDAGLIRVRQVARDVSYSTYEYFDGIGLVDVITETRLTRKP